MGNKTRDQAYPRLETERLVLRALRIEDTGFAFREWGDPLVIYFMWDKAPLQTREQQVAFSLLRREWGESS